LLYKSKAKHEREQWITRTETIALIAKLDGCDRRSASKQLLDLLHDRKPRIKWGDSISPAIGVAAYDAINDFHFRRDKVFDSWMKLWRRLLIFRDDISRLAFAVSENGQAIDETAKKGAVRGDAVTDKKPNERQKAALAALSKGYPNISSKELLKLPDKELERAVDAGSGKPLERNAIKRTLKDFPFD